MNNTTNTFCVQSKQFLFDSFQSGSLFTFGTVFFICFVAPSFLFLINKISIQRVFVFLGGKIEIFFSPTQYTPMAHFLHPVVTNYFKGWGLSAKLGKHSAILGKLGTALQAYTLNPCTKFRPNPTSTNVNTDELTSEHHA